MSIEEIIRMAFDEGGTLALATFAIFTLNRVWKDRLSDKVEEKARYKALAERVTKALEDSTRAVTTLCERLDR